MKLSNSPAKAGPMSAAIAVGLTCVPRLDLDYFESQSDSSRLNQRLPGYKYRNIHCPGEFFLVKREKTTATRNGPHAFCLESLYSLYKRLKHLF